MVQWGGSDGGNDVTNLEKLSWWHWRGMLRDIEECRETLEDIDRVEIRRDIDRHYTTSKDAKLGWVTLRDDPTMRGVKWRRVT
jgi:hypothetical protein